MAEFTITLASRRPAEETFARLADWDAHSAAVPLTRLQHTGPPAVGQEFVARTGLGRLAFSDPMRVELFRPPAGNDPANLPGLVEVAKTGRVITGLVRWTVIPTAGGSTVEWQQHLRVPWLPRLLDPVVGLVGRLAYRAALARLLR